MIQQKLKKPGASQCSAIVAQRCEGMRARKNFASRLRVLLASEQVNDQVHTIIMGAFQICRQQRSQLLSALHEIQHSAENKAKLPCNSQDQTIKATKVLRFVSHCKRSQDSLQQHNSTSTAEAPTGSDTGLATRANNQRRSVCANSELTRRSTRL